MVILQIEHTVLDYDRWKEAFDNDPAGRQKSGVRRYRILRSVDDSNLIIIELEFDSVQQADALASFLHDNVFPRVEGSVIASPYLRITDVIEQKTY